MNIVATLLIRNEAELVADCLEHHLREGVAAFLVTDHLSADGLADVLRDYEDVIVHFQRETDERYLQDLWVTRMARHAAELRPDWIVHLDADERWYGLRLLEHIPEHYGWLRTGAWRNHLPVSETLPSPFQTQMMPYFEIPGRTGSQPPRFVQFGTGTGGKVVHRPDVRVQVGLGNHGLCEPDLPMLHYDGIEVHHYPVRSLDQFRRKVRTGAAAMDSADRDTSAAAHWRAWRDIDERGELDSLFREFLLTDAEIQERLASGTLFHHATNPR